MIHTNVEIAKKFLNQKAYHEQPSDKFIGELADKLGESPVGSVILIPQSIGGLIMGYNIYKKIQDGRWEFTGDI